LEFSPYIRNHFHSSNIGQKPTFIFGEKQIKKKKAKGLSAAFWSLSGQCHLVKAIYALSIYQTGNHQYIE
jgi:hypothetical protein